MTLAPLTRTRRVIVCCGSGGVGKTTTAAVLALEGARQGRRAVVVTIDPAKRLADALGLETLSDTPTRIEGDWPGELWALMLDTKSTFDALVLKYAPSAGQADGILRNRFYRNISSALSGTQEYMAMEKLYELHEEGGFELVVVDTPPTRNALDFIDAPRRLTHFLDNRLFRWMMMPTRAYLKAAGVATRTLLRVISRGVGSDVVQDAVAFFQAFEGMEDGFRQRAERVLHLLSDPATAFLLVTTPRADALEESRFFAAKLEEAGIPVEALVVNRMHPRFAPAGADQLRSRAADQADTDLAGLYENLADFTLLAEVEEAHVTELSARVHPAPLVRVPFLPSDVHDLEGLSELGKYLFDGDGEPAPVGTA
ncbi:MAG: ArsA family ATPase [Acidimicrobiia bacterium]|nr:ArsA family ATPase [Acidimicrobiia bacterium]